MQTAVVADNDEQVIPVDLGVRWAPNTSNPLLVQHSIQGTLVVGPHFDDADQRLVVIRIDGCWGVWLGPPNDEGRASHPLWDKGLSSCLWAGEVLHSRRIAGAGGLAGVSAITPRPRHWILLFKENTAECVGDAIRVDRVNRDELSTRLIDHRR